MKVELLVFEGCPNHEPARLLLQDCLSSLGIITEITEVQVESPELARLMAFLGSPTIRVNDSDVAPLSDSVEGVLNCRTYAVGGRLQGLPERAWVMEALRSARENDSHACCTPVASIKGEAHCLHSGAKGRSVKSVTLRALLKAELRNQVRDGVYHFCGDPTCDLVYFSTDRSQTFTKADLAVRVGIKETMAPRPLCYCFGHSYESLREEWAATGKISTPDAIKAEVKAGTCRCEVTNPGGGCCLGDVIKAAKEIEGSMLPLVALGSASPAPRNGCAMPDKNGSLRGEAMGDTGKARTIWAAIGLGVLASACCWLPLVLAGLGIATGTLGARIAWTRPWAFGALVVLFLGVVGWWAWKRFGSVDQAAGCCTVIPRFPALAAGILAASLILAWASPRLLHPDSHTTLTVVALSPPSGGPIFVLSTPQFDCPACVGTLPQRMANTPGVASVRMDFDKRETHIALLPGTEVDPILARWKKELGFSWQSLHQEAAPPVISGRLEAK